MLNKTACFYIAIIKMWGMMIIITKEKNEGLLVTDVPISMTRLHLFLDFSIMSIARCKRFTWEFMIYQARCWERPNTWRFFPELVECVLLKCYNYHIGW